MRLLEAARNHNIKKIVYLSSGGTVYGNPKYTPIGEEHPTNPISSYGITKLAIEKYLFAFNEVYGFNSVVLRVSNPFGPWQSNCGVQGVIGTFLRLALEGKEIEVWGDGTVVRDFIYVDDVIDAITSALNYQGKEVVFNIGAGVGTNINEIIFLLENALKKRIVVNYLPGRNIDVRENVLDVSKAHLHFGWRPKTMLSHGIARLIDSLGHGSSCPSAIFENISVTKNTKANPLAEFLAASGE